MSSAIFLADVDDYVAPSQACVNPLFATDEDEEKKKQQEREKAAQKSAAAAPPVGAVVPRQRRRRVPAAAVVSADVDAPRVPTVIPKPVDKVKASIADCLACSGCVTTAETVLMEEQHSLELLKQVLTMTVVEEKETKYQLNTHVIQPIEQRPTAARRRCVVATISPASWADLFRSLHCTPTTTPSLSSREAAQALQRQVTTFLCQTLGLYAVMDALVPLLWSLETAAQEFIQSYKQQEQVNGSNVNTNCLPIVSSSCPALVCLVEKSTHGAVPHLSKVKSPMALAPGVVTLPQQEQEPDNNELPSFFHVAVMPCHDKKLEASRPELSSSKQKVDMVITTTDLLHLMMEQMQQEQKTNGCCNHTTTNGGCSSTSNNNNNGCHPDKKGEEESTTNGGKDSCCNTTNGDKTDSGLRKELGRFIATLPLAPLVTYNNSSICSSRQQPPLLRQGSFGGLQLQQTPQKGGDDNNGNNTSSFFPYSSGGYADYIFRRASYELFGYRLAETALPWKPVSAVAAAVAADNKPAVRVSARTQKRNNTAAASSNVRRDYNQIILYQHERKTCTCVGGEGEGAIIMEDENGSSSSFSYSTEKCNNNNSSCNCACTPVLRFSTAYGMQTMQRALQPFRKSSTTSSNSNPTTTTNGGSNSNSKPVVDNNNNHTFDFDYLEAMACPSGCINGGGQIRTIAAAAQTTSDYSNNSTSTRETPVETRQRVAATRDYFAVLVPSPPAVVVVQQQNEENKAAEPVQNGNGEETNEQFSLYTTFKAVPPMAHSRGAAAGVTVQELLW